MMHKIGVVLKVKVCQTRRVNQMGPPNEIEIVVPN